MVTLFRTPIGGMRDGQARTHEGGVPFAVDYWTRLRRFLFLGTDSGPFYVDERRVPAERARIVGACLALNPARTVAEIVAVAESARAAKSEPVLLALALAAAHAEPMARQEALTALPRVCRSGAHLFRFAGYIAGMRGWGRGLRRAIGGWYNALTAEELVAQALRYRQRSGWSHADLLRLAHPKTLDPARNAVYKWIVDGVLLPELADAAPGAYAQLTAYADLMTDNGSRGDWQADLIRTAHLPREVIPPHLLSNPDVWFALLDEMPVAAMLRNLVPMARAGLLTPGSAASRIVRARLQDDDRLRRSRLHPLAVLAALKVYSQGDGEDFKATWEPVAAICDALDSAFYAAFANVAPTGKRILLAVPEPAPVDQAPISGLPSLTVGELSAFLALWIATVEPDHAIVVAGDRITPLAIDPTQRLEDVVLLLRGKPKRSVTRTSPLVETWSARTTFDASIAIGDAGSVNYARPQSDLATRRVSVITGAASISPRDICNPSDLDIVGFDPTTPRVIADFISGAF